MDLLTFALEALFALVFLWALATWWRRRDALSLDVVLVFSAMAALFVLGVVRLLVGELKSDPVTADIPIIILTGHDLSAADKHRLNGKVLGIVSKGPDAQEGLRAWLVAAGASTSRHD